MKKEKAAPKTAETKKKKKSNWTTWLLILILLFGAAIMAYPTVSDWWNSFHASRAIASYSSTVENTDSERLNAMLEAARAYNQTLLTKENPYVMTDEDLEEYRSLLDLSGTGIMGYITIKSIGVYIPIYPVGGESTHTVLSGHRGLPSAKLFTDLDQVKEGDQFSITVLNQMISYEVDQIRIVEPGDISELGIVPGQDYCTLVTCTPYGINTHRMLVRGHRVANESGDLVVTPEAYRIPNYLTIPAVAIPLLFLFLIGMLIYYRISNAKMKKNDVYRLIEEVTEERPSSDTGKKKAGRRRKE